MDNQKARVMQLGWRGLESQTGTSKSHIVIHDLNERGVWDSQLVFQSVKDGLETGDCLARDIVRQCLYDPCRTVIRTFVSKDLFVMEDLQLVIVRDMESRHYLG